MSEAMEFVRLFSDCAIPEADREAAGRLQVLSAKLFAEKHTMEVLLSDAARDVDDAVILRLEKALRDHYGLRQVKCGTNAPPPATEKAKKEAGTLSWGKPGKAEPRPIRDIHDAAGPVALEGEVFAVDVRPTRNGNGAFVSFDITDFDDSLRATRYLETAEAAPLLVGLKEGKTLRVWGKMELDRRGRDGAMAFRFDGLREIPPVLRQDNAPEKRVELHLHTAMSMMDATSDPAMVLKTAARWGHEAVAITDHGVLHAFPDAYATQCKLKKAGTPVKVLYGCEAYFVRDDLPEEIAEGKRRRVRSHHMILLARDDTGLKNLYKLTSLAHLDHFNYHANIPKSLLDTCREGLIVGSACEAGELFSAIVRGEDEQTLLDIAAYYDYLEIQPLCNNAFLLRGGQAKSEEDLRDFNRRVVELGRRLDKPVVATGDVHFLEPRDEIYRHILLASKQMEDADKPLPLYFKTTEEMLEEFSYLGEETARAVVVDNPRKIAALCGDVRPVREGEFFPKMDGSAEELRRLSETKARALYGEQLPAILAERMETELSAIIGKGYDIIYMIAQKLVARSLSEGYLVGSRGSVGSSIVAFLSGITEVNALPPHYRCPHCLHWDFPENPGCACGADLPDKDCPDCRAPMQKDGFDIPFATFLGFEADKKPDIDLNFSGEYQARAHQHTIELFGEGKVFRAGTIGTVAEKTATGFVLKYLEERGKTAGQAEIARLARGCVGVKRTTGQHPGGLIIVPDDNDIYEFCPVQRPADKRDSDIITTHFDYHSIEENLLKLDLLGHDDPTMIRRLEELTGLDATKIPLDDPATMSLFSSSEALGIKDDRVLGPTGACAIPEFGTKFVREMLVSTKPRTFDELTRISGLSHGTDVWLGNAADIIAAGRGTLKDVICARDDITLYLISKGLPRKTAFTISESVRKGKGLTPDWETAMKNAQVPDWYIESCQKIKYLFPKAHAVAYVIMAFRIAWFKVNHPLAFYAAYFSIRAGSLDARCMTQGFDVCGDKMDELTRKPDKTAAEEDMLSTLEVCYEFYKRGFSFAPLDIYRSDATRFLITDGGLRPPFLAIPGLGETAAFDIVRERERAEFLSVEDLAGRCRKLSKTHIEALTQLGAVDMLPESTQLNLFG